jgi:membrane protease YdiL (CAAX protease family)
VVFFEFILIVHEKVNNMKSMNIQSYSILLLDHAFVAVFAIAFPVYCYIGYRKALPALIDGTLSRRTEYIHTSIIQWVLALSGLAIWQAQNRDWSELGLGGSIDGKFMLATAIVVLVTGMFLAQLRAVRRGDERILSRLDAGFEAVKPLMPHSTAELHAFYGLCFTAGIVEELLWRGFLIWYLVQFVPIWVAALISAVLFGAAHAYQGVASVPKIAMVGLGLAGLYLLSGSLWLPILIHIVADLIQGRTAFDYIKVRPSADNQPLAAHGT